jgi:hypothetical protein
MAPVFRLELLSASLAGANLWLPPILAPAVRVESRGTVRANDLQVLQTIVIRNTVNVIEDQRHRPALPIFVLAAHLAAPVLQTLRE